MFATGALGVSQRLQYPLIKESTEGLGVHLGIYRLPLRDPLRDLWGLGFRGLQYPLMKEYTFNYSRIPSMVQFKEYS